MPKKLNFDAVEDAWLVLNDTVLQILMDEGLLKRRESFHLC